MGRGQQMSTHVENEEEEKIHTTHFRSTAWPRKLVCVVGLFVALFLFAIVRSYSSDTNPEVPLKITEFFEGQPAPDALHEGPFMEDVPYSTVIMVNQTDHEETEPESSNENSRFPTFDSSAGNKASAAGKEEAWAPNLETDNTNSKEFDIKSLKVSANDTSSYLKNVTGHEDNAPNNRDLEVPSESPSPAVTLFSERSDNVFKESYENFTKEAEAPVPTPSQTSQKENSERVIVLEETQAPSTSLNTSNSTASEGECDLALGKWIPYSRPPQYNSSTCKTIQGHQNCEKNGRPDTGYLYWKWKPDLCELPRIDPAKFLNAMRNRSIVFAGDSIARNQFQSLLCVLSQVEDPRRTFHTQDDKNNAYLFQSFNVSLGIYWSPYLVRMEDKSITWSDNSTDTVTHIYFDELDKNWLNAAVGADILHLSTGQWWYKRAMYFEGGKAIGCHAWPACFKQIGFAMPYEKALAYILKGSLSIPGYHGTTVYRSFGPEHFEHGDWNHGGKCNRTAPGGVPTSFLTGWMYNIQVKQFKKVAEELDEAAKGRLRVLRITGLAQIRADGHPNKYRSKDDKKFDSQNLNVVRNDCLHWCLPGPIDTWNDLLVESLRDIIFK
ncbi:xyloglucan O-acetyltransferase 1 [Physcomitrium patens]|uniref:Mannan O-acetyltransferase 5 n=1 Tax=Physcomitrium patens TaxID=3218 RepID=A0A2K1L4H6_PHYPA|nr:protein trichome birefringence-like 25 [Physcomitrium patens]XP_024402140.1 protein trichome birefringence-like 25 [Physcomitrium patens]PNR60939.1 hypothetical protein PHYPA_003732 [Physcomitrium patens]QDE12524.1 mannan O-acetyltransferase 5 [Physcomitrium patens]|eukprot:XP_024402139.1 protein trichome birefringence-like 25 [Physcomitrella patens]